MLIKLYSLLAALFCIAVSAQLNQDTSLTVACTQGLSCEQTDNSISSWEPSSESESSELPSSSAPDSESVSLWQPESTLASSLDADLAAPPTLEQPQAPSSSSEPANTPSATPEKPTESTSISYRFTLGYNPETTTTTSAASTCNPRLLMCAGLLYLYFIISGI
ncbi:hypothetical protein BX667DRAFT_499980 [Coemansia mojavensis]|nr:hypothetical protein BX667DRAFT_499980 [Coemansia mojavensis]